MMKRILFLLSVQLLWLMGSPLFGGENYAFLVGVGTYDEKELKSLPYTRPDILEFRDVLLDSGFKKENMIVMVDDVESLPRTRPIGRFLPEAVKIRKELTILIQALEQDDTLVIALAGHGIQYKGETESHFCPSDVRLGDRSTLVSLDWLYRQLQFDEATGQGCRARQRLLIVDACRNDPRSQMARSAGGPELESLTRPQLAQPPQGVVALFSCAEGQQALEHDPLRHGVFFFHVLDAWRGKADGDMDDSVTLDEMIAYAKQKTAAYARIELRASQTPRQKGYYDGTWILKSIPDVQAELGLRFVTIPEGRDYDGKTTPAYDLLDTKITISQFRKFARAASYRTVLERRRDGTLKEIEKELVTYYRERFAEIAKSSPQYVSIDGLRPRNEPKAYYAIELERKRLNQCWNDPTPERSDEHPVAHLTYYDVQQFLNWINVRAQTSGVQFRLPTYDDLSSAIIAPGSVPSDPVERDQFFRTHQQEQAKILERWRENGRPRVLLDDETRFGKLFHIGTTPVRVGFPNRQGIYDLGYNGVELDGAAQDMSIGRFGMDFVNREDEVFSIVAGVSSTSPAPVQTAGFRLVRLAR